VGFHNYRERIANNFSSTAIVPGCAPSLKPSMASHKDKYRPTVMVMDRNAARQGSQGPRAHLAGEKYLGDKDLLGWKV
jgi:hypothetical protein